MGLSRDQVNAQLRRLGDQVVAAVVASRQSVLDSTTCDSWLFSDKDACNSMLRQVDDLYDRAVTLRVKANALASSPTITREQVEDLRVLGQLFIDSAKYTGEAGNTGDLEDLFKATVRDLGSLVAETVGTGVSSFLGGLGPVGIVVLGVAIYAAVRVRFG